MRSTYQRDLKERSARNDPPQDEWPVYRRLPTPAAVPDDMRFLTTAERTDMEGRRMWLLFGVCAEVERGRTG